MLFWHHQVESFKISKIALSMLLLQSSERNGIEYESIRCHFFVTSMFTVQYWKCVILNVQNIHGQPQSAFKEAAQWNRDNALFRV